MTTKSKLNRRQFLQGLGAGSTALLIAACAQPASAPAPGPAPTQKTESKPAAAPPPAAKVEVVLWQHEYAPLTQAYQQVIKEYQATQARVTVAFDSVSANDFEQKLLTAIAAGSGPDIFRMPNWSTAAYAAKGIVKPLEPAALGKGSHTDLMNEYNPPSSLNGFVIDGKLYALPIEISILMPYYRVDILEKDLGIDKTKLPKTWDELWSAAAKLTQKDSAGKITRIGFAWTWNAIWMMHQYSPILYQQGGAILSSDGKTCTLDSPEGLKALQILTEPYRSGGASVDFNVPQAFETGKQCITFGNPPSPTSWRLNNPNFDYGNQWLPARFPQTPGGKLAAYVWMPASLAPNPKTKYVTEMYDVMKFIADRPEVFWDVANMMNTRKKFLQSESFKKAQHLSTYIEDAPIAQPAVVSPVYEEIKTAIFQMVERVTKEGKTPEESLKLAAADITKSLGR
jgi:ABC-type glycerol-3-phosphate transport system substrate-binding protein